MPTPADILDALAAGFPAIPGVIAVHLFGSLTGPAHDAHSDIDLQVFTSDLDAAWSRGYALLQRIAPVLIEFPLVRRPKDRASTFLFQGLSPANKLDIGYQPTHQRDAWQRQQPCRVVWERSDSSSPVPCTTASTASTTDELVPRDPVTLAVLDQLLGAVRYTKARQRGQVATARRFAVALAEATLARHVAAANMQRPWTGQKLTTPEYVALDRTLTLNPDPTLPGSLFFADTVTMDRRVHDWVGALADHAIRSTNERPEIHAAITSLTHWLQAECTRLASP